MPYQLKVEPQGIYKRFWGHVTDREFLDAVLQNHQRKDYDESVYAINDFSDVTSHGLVTQSLYQAVAHALGARYSNPDVLILVVARDPSIRDLAMQFGTLTRYRVELFDTLSGARERLQTHHPDRRGRLSGWGALEA